MWKMYSANSTGLWNKKIARVAGPDSGREQMGFFGRQVESRYGGLGINSK
jgi:hypothetical protein